MSYRQTTRSHPNTHNMAFSSTKNDKYFVNESTEVSENSEYLEESREYTSDTEVIISPQPIQSRSRPPSRATNLRSREEEPEKRIRSSSRTGYSKREEQPTILVRSSSRNRSEMPQDVTFGMQGSMNQQRERSASRRRDEEAVAAMPLSRQRSHSGLKDNHRHYFALEISKIRGMSTVPTTRPYFKDLKLRIYVTWLDETVQSPQIARAGHFDPDDLVFKFPVSSKMAQIAMDEFKLKLVMKLERDEEKGLRKWTHVVGKATITKDSGKLVKRGLYRVDLEAEVPDHGMQQLEYSVNVM